MDTGRGYYKVCALIIIAFLAVLGRGTKMIDSRRVSGGAIINGNVFFGSPITFPIIGASIYLYNDTITVPVPSGSTFTTVTGFEKFKFESYAIADTAHDRLIILRNGKYYCFSHLTITNDHTDLNLTMGLFLNNVLCQDIVKEQRIVGDFDFWSDMAMSGILEVNNAPDTVSVGIRHNESHSIDFFLKYASLLVQYPGD